MAWSMERCDLGLDVKTGVVHPATDAYAAEAFEALKARKVIAVPTDTLYGFACDAWYVCYFNVNLCLKFIAYSLKILRASFNMFPVIYAFYKHKL
jgi:hypothetical protein